MPQKVNKDGFATVLVGDYELKRKVFAGDEVPDDWQLAGGDTPQQAAPEPAAEPTAPPAPEPDQPVVRAKRGRKAAPEPPPADG